MIADPRTVYSSFVFLESQSVNGCAKSIRYMYLLMAGIHQGDGEKTEKIADRYRGFFNND